MKGMVVKGVGGFYFVKGSDEIYRTKGRGILKRGGNQIYVGDIVEFTPPSEGEDDGLIKSIEPRKNCFDRPPVSNVDIMIVTMAAASPDPNLSVIDKLLVMAEKNGCQVVLCINKADLVSEEEINNLKAIYEGVYPLVVAAAKFSQGADELKELIGNKNAVFAGPSGVGKSSLTNMLIPDADMETGDISQKTYRGKHTTRHVAAFPCGGGYLFDTPGFTSFDLQGIEESELGDCYPEIRKRKGGCRFEDCKHINEPDCAIKEALARGEISNPRYESYVAGVKELAAKKKY